MLVYTDIDEAINQLQHSQVLGLDLETTPILNEKPTHWVDLKVISLSDGEKSAVLHFPTSEVPERILRFIESREKLITFNGAAFDLPVLFKYGFNIKEGQHFDCYIASRTLDTTQRQLIAPGRHSLSGVMERFLGETFKLSADHTAWGAPTLTQEQIDYSARDVEYLPLLCDLLTTEAKKRGASAAINVEQSQSVVTAYITYNGIPASEEKFQYMLDNEILPESDKLEVEIEAIADMLGVANFSITKPRRIAKLLNGQLGLQLKATKKGASSTSKSSLMPHTVGEHGALVKDIIRLKLLTRASGKTAVGRHIYDGRVYAQWNQTGTITRRYSTSKFNVLGISAKYDRPILGNQVGHKVLSGDFSQVELHVGAHLSGDEQMKEDLKGDVYVNFAKYGFNLDEISKEVRQASKIAILGGNYGGGPRVIMENYLEQVGKFMTVEQAKKLQAARDTRWPDMAKFRKNWGSGNNGLSVRLKGGYICAVTPGDSTNPLSNFPVQGTAAVILKLSLINAFRKGLIPKFPAAPFHDEIALFNVPEEEVEDVQSELGNCMTEAMQLLFPDVAPKVDFAVSDYWIKS